MISIARICLASYSAGLLICIVVDKSVYLLSLKGTTGNHRDMLCLFSYTYRFIVDD